jgi:ATP-dependent Clp protease adaptor protein ClpS|tara:strand:- start:372 stop:659 length:288 start_codon:yes stop_codon:yes gene_type:complete
MSVKLEANSDVAIDNKLSSLNPVALVLHNDDINSMDHVVQTLVSNIPEITVEEALEKMLKAHNFGTVILVKCPLERAELYQQRLITNNLITTIQT